MRKWCSRSASGLLIAAGIASLLACSASSSSEESSSNADLPTQSAPSPQQEASHNSSAPPISSSSPVVVTPDWGIAATLTAMGYPPIATGDIRVYPQWVDDPKLPDSVVDLGIRYQPNAELVAQLDVDLVLDNFFYEHIRPIYGDTPAVSVTFMSEGPNAKWEDFAKPTRQLGELISQPEAAEQYLLRVQSQLRAAGETLAARHPDLNKVAVVQFADSNNLRMYSYNSLFQVALNNMGLQLEAIGDGNTWGFVPIHLGDLAKLDADTCLIVIEPVSPMLQAELADNLVWQRLGFGASRCMAVVAPIWIYGGSSSLVTFANRLQEAKFIGTNPVVQLTSKTAHNDNKQVNAGANASLSPVELHNGAHVSNQVEQEARL